MQTDSLLCSVPGQIKLPVVFEKILLSDGMGVSYVCVEPNHFSEHSDRNFKISVLFKQASIWAKWQTATGQLKRKHVKEGHVCIIPANLPHETSVEKQMEMVVINLEPTFICSVASELNKKSFEIVEHWAARDPLIQQLGLALRSEFIVGLPQSSYVESVGNILVTHLLRHYCANKQSPDEPTFTLPEHKLRQAIAYINGNLEQNITLAQLASFVEMSQYRFARAFKQSTGISPHQYILECKVEQAKTLLKHTQMSIVEISYSLGFASQSHFTSTFRRFTAITPKEYKKAL
ncbi:helix-turn-helix transcriptional regulator [Fischerella sp. PCC 9605]|uniref:helix-turn-helix transcriptional regulator n=1 Tax=Fischerella sp. PCC 9605 TaxID=1173024 RepID=UPI000685B680|nr:AraC family transcriptional regulator [Fischerella sp. PCC 9605]